MTPKEKAKDLVDKFYQGNVDRFIGQAKDCALITIDEILLWDVNERGTIDENVEYWNKVKDELKQI